MEAVLDHRPDADVDFPLDVAALAEDLLDRLDRMREHAPIFWSEKNGAWIVTGHQEVVDGYYGKLPLSAVRLPFLAIGHLGADDLARIPNLLAAPKHWLLNMDDPDHQRIRRLLVKAFGKPVVESIRPDIVRYIEESFDEIAAIGEPFDFVKHVARMIPARMILKMFDFDDHLVSKLHRWSVLMNLSGNLNVPIDDLVQVDRTLLELRALFEPAFEDRRRNPRDDFLSALVTATENGETLSDDEMFGVCVITLIAGHDTTANTMSLGMVKLAEDADALARLREAETMDLNAVMEVQRRAGMSTLMSRVVSHDFAWNGHQLREGQFVLLSQLAANRDPSVFPDPDTTDFTRRQVANMTFAPGVHHCIGHVLAKMVLGEFFQRFIGRFNFEVLDERLDFAPTMSFRGLDTLTMRVHER